VISGLGAAAADMLYGGVAGFSTLAVQFIVREQFWIRLFGGILLVVNGISNFFVRPEPLNAQRQDRGSAYSDLRSTFLLTLESGNGAVVCCHSGGTRHGRSKAVVVDRVSRRRDLLRFNGVVDCAEQHRGPLPRPVQRPHPTINEPLDSEPGRLGIERRSALNKL